MNTRIFESRFVQLLTALVITVLMQIAFSQTAFAATATWDGEGADGNWSTAANWVGDVVPTDGDDIVLPGITSAATASVTMDNDILTSINSITVNNGDDTVYSHFLNSSTAFTLNGNISVGENQTLDMTGQVTLGADVSVLLSNSVSEFRHDGPSNDFGDFNLTIELVNYDTVLTKQSTASDLPDVRLGNGTSGYSATANSRIIVNGVHLDWEIASATLNSEIELNKSILSFADTNGVATTDFGDATNGIIVNNSQLDFNGSADFVLDEPLVLNGNLFGVDNKNVESFGVEAVTNFGGGSDTILTLSGPVELQTNTLFDPYSGNIAVSGDLTGKYIISASRSYNVTDTRGHIIINSSSNESAMPNGNYVVADSTDAISDSAPDQDLLIQVGTTVTINGERGFIIVAANSVLQGTGTVDGVQVFDTGTVAPGESPGCLTTGDLTFTGGTYAVEVNGTTACSQYDRTNVNGTVDLGTATTLSVASGFTAAGGDEFTIINNDGADAVIGTFQGLSEGASLTSGDNTYTISYTGGDGNDVVLTAVAGPGTPDTGFALASQNTAVIITVTLLATTSLYIAARKNS